MSSCKTCRIKEVCNKEYVLGFGNDCVLYQPVHTNFDRITESPKALAEAAVAYDSPNCWRAVLYHGFAYKTREEAVAENLAYLNQPATGGEAE